MIKNITIICALMLLSSQTFSQQHSLAKQWDKRFGGVSYDYFYSCISTADGGYLLGGSVYSGYGGDKSQGNWDTSYSTSDFWVVKTDSLGNKEWDRRFGGYSNDGISFSCVWQTSDGYLLIGESSSGVGGDKTQNCWGGYDYWIVKIDLGGSKVWDKRFGGTSNDLLFASTLTYDGGLLLGGTSYSDSSGDKTQNNWGGSVDYWVVKVDAEGNKLWDKRFGGYGGDFLYAVQPANDGGYILGGISMSDTGGDKTQANWAIDWYNYWIVKIDSVGNKQWDRVYGGTVEDYLEAVLSTPDGGFLLGGFSQSGISGNKSQSSQGGYDYWVVKIDSLGNKEWDKDYGGNGDDELYSLALMSDGGYLLAGNSTSTASGDKSENNSVPAGAQTWIIKTDSAGNKKWDKTIFLTSSALVANAFETSDGCYIVSSTTAAEPGYYKSQPSWDSTGDYWIVKFRDTTIVNGIVDLTPKLQFTVYPNPFSSELDLTLAQQNLHQATFTITNLLGQTIYSQNETNLSSTYTKMLDLRYLPSGVYWVSVVVDGDRVTKEVVKQ